MLTIWKWGRTVGDIKAGLPLGSFELWSRWVRDPLLALGCQDPAQRVSEAKERDESRQAVADVYTIWWKKHGDQPVKVHELDYEVKRALDPQDRSRQYLLPKSRALSAPAWRVSRLHASGRSGIGGWRRTR